MRTPAQAMAARSLRPLVPGIVKAAMAAACPHRSLRPFPEALRAALLTYPLPSRGVSLLNKLLVDETRSPVHHTYIV